MELSKATTNITFP